MIPLRDKNPTSSFPLVTIALIVINTFIYFAQGHLGPLGQAPYEMVPRDVITGQAWTGVLHVLPSGGTQFEYVPLDQLEYYRFNRAFDMPVLPPAVAPWLTIFTAMFLHANFLHLAGNMLFLWIFGNNVEDALGKIRFSLFYFACGLAAAVVQIATDANSLIPTLGASGAIAGVLAAYIIMWPRARVSTLIFLGFFVTIADISAFWVIGIWIALQVIEGFTRLGGMATGGVAYFAHIGGFFAGIALIAAMGGRRLGEKQLRIAGYSRRQY